MKLISIILFIAIATPIYSQVYTSEKVTGHKIEFLIISKIQVLIYITPALINNSYHLQNYR